jgi:NAD(P)-dependent dehydrogenase (short-subunit alcohol dehydrogenase family)
MGLLDLTGRRVVITGAGRGIGREIARVLAAHGLEEILVARSREELERTAEEVRELGSRARIVTADLADLGGLGTLVDRIAETADRIDILINNAGTAFAEPFESTTPEQWDRVMRLNAASPYFLTQKLLPLLDTSDAPTTVNISSNLGHKGYALQSAYSASKHALAGWTKAVARELQERGYRFYTLSPGGVDTPLVSKTRPDLDTSVLIDPREIAETVEFLVTRSGRGAIDEITLRRAASTPWQ